MWGESAMRIKIFSRNWLLIQDYSIFIESANTIQFTLKICY